MTSNRDNPSVVIIGAGMTGICLAIKLREAGITDVVMLEKAASVGGTWRDNTYPGVACDVPSHAYTYSFAPNPEWSASIACGAEIHRYFIGVFEQYDLASITRFNDQVVSSIYGENEQGESKWTVATAAGKTYVADILFGATGMLHQPVLPDIKGRECFNGVSFHSARWNHDIDLRNKRIGVIGTGSSAAQLIPELINTEGTQISVFQRSAHWLVNFESKAYSEKEKQQFRDKPELMQKTKEQSLWWFEKGTTSLTSNGWKNRWLRKVMAWNARRHIKRSIKDPVLREQLTPDHEIGCNRVVMNATFYEAIQKNNASLVTQPIQCIEAAGVRTNDNVLHELDVLVYATGFDPFAYMRPMTFLGKNGMTIDKQWEQKMQAYRSLLVPNFPNFFLMLGPNSPVGNYSIIAISEIQSDYAIDLVKSWQRGEMDTIEVRDEAVQQWNAMLGSRLKNTVWATGCSSWYQDDKGDIFSWPDSWKRWCELMAKPDLNDFHSSRS